MSNSVVGKLNDACNCISFLDSSCNRISFLFFNLLSISLSIILSTLSTKILNDFLLVG